MNHRRDYWRLLWEVPLGISSFLFYKATRTFFRGLVRLHDKRQSGKPCKWQPLSGELISKPLVLPLVMTSAPRWNTHALIAMLEPVVVHETLEIDSAVADRSAQYWTIVVVAYPDRRTITSVGSMSSPYPGGIARLLLPAGRYRLGLRYYQWRRDAELPAVRADGGQVASSVTVPADVNGFYRAIGRRSNFAYTALHYYVFILLRYRRWFPASFVEHEFLPMGNPETEFYFDALRKGERLQLSVAPEAFEQWDVLLTLYDRASFPTYWEQVKESRREIIADGGDRMCLIRVHRRLPGPDEYQRNWIEAVVV